MKLIFIRHGETRFNAEKRLTGQIDLPLTQLGEQQAEAVAKRLATEKIDLLLSSTLLRAHRTAEIVGQHHRNTPQAAAWLNERYCGVLEGLTKAEMKQRFPAVRKAYKNRHLDLALEGDGETSLQFHNRVVSGMVDLSRRHSEDTIAAVCHGGTIREVFNFVFDCQQNGNHLRCMNCSVSVFHFEDHHWSMESWGDSSHLSGIDKPPH